MRIKRPFTRSLMAFCLLLLCLPLFGEDAWMFRGNPAHSGVYEAAGVATFWRREMESSYWRNGDWISSGGAGEGLFWKFRRQSLRRGL